MTRRQPTKLELVCSVCGYGAIRQTAPTCCPMCHAPAAWIEGRRRKAPARREVA